jgi:4-hydroxysphinganine ceramide fatty acyl 2-hydroxylase
MPLIQPSDLLNEKKCLVTMGNRVFDVTSFLADHPGGEDVIAPYRGKEVSAAMSDALSHQHSSSAYEMLEEYFIGHLPTSPALSDSSDSTYVEDTFSTGMTCEEDLNVPTNIHADYLKHKFLDLSQPLLPQVVAGGFTKEFYLAQVHRPRHYPGGSARLMPYAWMEPLSKTPWWVVPLVWTPCVAYGTYIASTGLSMPYSRICNHV